MLYRTGHPGSDPLHRTRHALSYTPLALHSINQTTTFPDASDGEKTNSISAAMIPTGKNSSTNGGGGSGGNINGSTTIDAARATRTRIDPKLKHRTIFLISKPVLWIVSDGRYLFNLTKQLLIAFKYYMFIVFRIRMLLGASSFAWPSFSPPPPVTVVVIGSGDADDVSTRRRRQTEWRKKVRVCVWVQERRDGWGGEYIACDARGVNAAVERVGPMTRSFE